MIWDDPQLEALFDIQRTHPLNYKQRAALAWAIARRFLTTEYSNE